jgi:hypothetical protein
MFGLGRNFIIFEEPLFLDIFLNKFFDNHASLEINIAALVLLSHISQQLIRSFSTCNPQKEIRFMVVLCEPSDPYLEKY